LEHLRDSPNIIRLEKVAKGTEYAYFFLEVGGSDLFEICRHKRMSEEHTRIIFKQMVSGLLSVHKANFCHHDVKLENFLFGNDGQIKLIDFGYSLCLTDDNDWVDSATRRVRGEYSAGSPAYSSFEVLLKQPHSPQKTDIYGLGVCLFRLVCGKFPFCDPDHDSLDILKKKMFLMHFWIFLLKFLPSFVICFLEC